MKRKLLFVAPSLRLAGAEKVVYTLINSIDDNSFEINLCCILEKELSDYFSKAMMSLRIFCGFW